MSSNETTEVVTAALSGSSMMRILDLVNDAAQAVTGMWDPELKTFWRNTEHRAAKQGAVEGTVFPTVSFRSLEALLRLLQERPQSATDNGLLAAIGGGTTLLVSRKEEELRSDLGLTSKQNVLNPFTLSLYIDCLVGLSKQAQSEPTIPARIEEACTHLLSYREVLNKDKAGPDVHPFVLFHMVRAIHSASSFLEEGDLCDSLLEFRTALLARMTEQVKGLLAQDNLGIMNPGEGVALAFCAAGLSISQDAERLPFVRAAIRASLKFQDSSGCWPLGRIVPENKDIEVKQDLQIPTYEVAWAVCDALLALIESRSDSLKDEFIGSCFASLARAVWYCEASVTRLDGPTVPKRGWCTEHAFGKPLVESWTSATVLQLGLSFLELSQKVDRQVVLRNFTWSSPSDHDWPTWQRWDSYKESSDPEPGIGILKYIDRMIVESVLAAPGRLPNSESKNVSMLLFGPPGTSKTTVVKAVADGLGWPVVSLSPGNFIERGLEYIEAQAKHVFDMLHRLTHVVVLFDECDELFRDRKPSAGTDQVRNITAFVTASMLPKLQDLHDRGRVVFAICTNHLESMDPAVKRSGRIDHLIGIGPPDERARRKILEQALTDEHKMAYAISGVDELASRTERFTRKELDRAAKLLIASELKSERGARSTAKKIAEALEPSVTISAEEFEEFQRLKLAFSHPHLEKAKR